MGDTIAFTEKLSEATEGNFQINTDGFPAYKDAIVYSLGAQLVDFAQVIKIYRSNQENETRHDFTHWKAKSNGSHVDAPHDSSNERFQQEMVESEMRLRATICLLQFLQAAYFPWEMHASDGERID